MGCITSMTYIRCVDIIRQELSPWKYLNQLLIASSITVWNGAHHQRVVWASFGTLFGPYWKLDILICNPPSGYSLHVQMGGHLKVKFKLKLGM